MNQVVQIRDEEQEDLIKDEEAETAALSELKSESTLDSKPTLPKWLQVLLVVPRLLLIVVKKLSSNSQTWCCSFHSVPTTAALIGVLIGICAPGELEDWQCVHWKLQ
jgi:hypothetical protein